MTGSLSCPKCQSLSVYQDMSLWICGECAYEWNNASGDPLLSQDAEDEKIRDANGVILQDGDAVIVLKDLKIKGSSNVVKGGTKVRVIRLTNGHDDHNIACKIEGIGALNLKSEFVKKA